MDRRSTLDPLPPVSDVRQVTTFVVESLDHDALGQLPSGPEHELARVLAHALELYVVVVAAAVVVVAAAHARLPRLPLQRARKVAEVTCSTWSNCCQDCVAETANINKRKSSVEKRNYTLDNYCYQVRLKKNVINSHCVHIDFV
jgi:hypothetical protein